MMAALGAPMGAASIDGGGSDTGDAEAVAEVVAEAEVPVLTGPCKTVHAWVLLMTGKRDVSEAVFIEPSTGRRYPLHASPYLVRTRVADECSWAVVQVADDRQSAHTGDSVHQAQHGMAVLAPLLSTWCAHVLLWFGLGWAGLGHGSSMRHHLRM